jgi:hypothetical protein
MNSRQVNKTPLDAQHKKIKALSSKVYCSTSHGRKLIARSLN